MASFADLIALAFRGRLGMAHGRPVKVRPPKVKKEHAPVKTWVLVRPANWWTETISADTKSEARAFLKKKLGKPLPHGCIIRRVGPLEG
jgi:hypothetical protein